MKKSLVIVTTKKSIKEKIRYTIAETNYNISVTYLSNAKNIEKFLKNKIDLIIIDNEQKDEYKTCKIAQEISKEKDIPFIILISEEEEKIFENKEFYPLSIFLSKPFTKTELKNNIEMIFYKYEFIKQTSKINQEQQILLNNIQNQVWFLTRPDIYGRVNKAHAEFLGFKKNELENKKLKEVFPEQKAKKLINFNKKVFSKKEKVQKEFWLKNTNLEDRLISINATPNLNENMKVEFVVCSAEDITEKKEMEKQLMQREQRFLSMIATLPDILVLFNKKGVYKNIWTGHEENLYKEKTELLGNNFEDILPEKVAAKIRDHLDKALKYNKLQVFEYKLPVLDGGMKYFESRMTAISQDQAVVVIRDITDRKEAEKELEVQKAYFKQLFENSPDAIAILNTNSEVINVNESFTELFGYKIEEIKGKLINEFLAPKKYKKEAYKVSKRICSGEVVQKETVRLNKNGEKIEVYLLSYPIQLDYDKVGMYALYRDISDRKTLEKNLRESKNKIEELHEIAIEMETIDNEDEIYKLTVDAAENILNFDVCSLDIVEDNMFVVKARSTGVRDDGIDEKAPITTGVAGKVYKTGESRITGDVRDDPDAEPVNSAYKSAMTVPIDEFGIFQVISNKKEYFDEVDLELTELLIAHTSAAIKRIRAEKRIKYLGYHDSLTDLYNRAYFEEEMERLDVKRNLPFSIIIGDLNNLKKVNDKYGHDKGDEVIKNIANKLKENCREDDILARWGGDEFGLLLPQTDNKTAHKVMQRIHTHITNYSYKEIDINLALGLATKTTPFEDIDEIFKKADDNMYENKSVIKGNVG
ncbi:MAG: PAS domain S-box protein [Bacillota bacterium]